MGRVPDVQNPAGPDAWESELHWDDEVDVLCVGSGPGVLAHAVFSAALGADVLLVDAAAPTDVTDADTRAFLGSMTDDLGPVTPAGADLEVAVLRAEPVPARTDPRAPIEPFIGARLREFALRCVASPFGVLYTEVPDAGWTAMRIEAGDTVQVASIGTFRAGVEAPAPALTAWLDEQAHACGVARAADSVAQRLIFENGRVAGAELAAPSGTTLVRALAGVALSTRSAPDGGEWPAQPELGGRTADVAIIARTAGRFGRLVLLNPR